MGMEKFIVFLVLFNLLPSIGSASAQIQLRQGRVVLDIESNSSGSTSTITSLFSPQAARQFEAKGVAYITHLSPTDPRSFQLAVQDTNLSLTLFPHRTAQAHTRIRVNYPHGLYNLFLTTPQPLATLSQTEVIKGTVCTHSEPFCTPNKAEIWKHGVYGVGYRVQGQHTLPEFAREGAYRTLSSTSIQPFVSNTLSTAYIKQTSVYSSSLTVATKLSENQPRGTYIGVIEIIGIPEY